MAFEHQLRPPYTLPFPRQVLTYGMAHHNPDVAVSNRLVDGAVYGNFPTVDTDIATLVNNFSANPIGYLGHGRNNILRITIDPFLSDHEKDLQAGKYLQALFELNVILDRQAFPPTIPTNAVFQGVPDYLPDGFSYLGPDPEDDAFLRKGMEN